MQKTLTNKIHHGYNPIYEVQEETPQQHFEGMATRLSAAVTLWHHSQQASQIIQMRKTRRHS
jgi:hypothetical protein